MTRFYIGCGSRSTPPWAGFMLAAVCSRLAVLGWTLREGGSDGADVYCGQGAFESRGEIDLYLPWSGFGERPPMIRTVLTDPRPGDFLLAAENHPNWNACDPAARKLLARNAAMFHGVENDAPLPQDRFPKMVVCWTPNGKIVGGTGHTIRIANALRIPVHNLGTQEGFTWAGNFIAAGTVGPKAPPAAPAGETIA